MRQNPQSTYAQNRCALSAQLRYRAQAAEAEVARIRAKADARIAAAEARADAAEARVSQLHRLIEAERAATVAHLESPEWERDLLLMAQGEIRAELLEQAQRRQRCKACGGFGHGAHEGLLAERIAALGKDHDLPPVLPPMSGDDPIDWPVRMGAVAHQGRTLNAAWLHAPKRKLPETRTEWRPAWERGERAQEM